MKAYIAWAGEYLSRVLKRLDTAAGIALGIVLFLVLFAAGGVGAALSAQISLGITLVLLFEATYGVYREERQMRAEREADIRMTARLGSYTLNTPDPGPERISLRAHVSWEIWVERDITTDKLVLNLIYLYPKRWWQFWKRREYPQRGIPSQRQGTQQYRKRINASQDLPFAGDDVFDYRGDRPAPKDAGFRLELVLITGVPVSTHRAPVYIDLDEIESRGTYPPL